MYNLNIKQKVSSVIEYLRIWFTFPVVMVMFTFLGMEVAWLTVYVGELFIADGNSHKTGDWYSLLFPLALLPLCILYRKGTFSRTSRGVTLFLSVCAIALAMEAWQGFVPGLQPILSLLIGAACGCFIYMDNLEFLRSRIDRIGREAASEKQRLSIQLSMEEARVYFDNTMRGIYTVGSAMVVVVSIIWAVRPVVAAMSDAEKLVLTLAGGLVLFHILGGALVWLARPASKCMSQLADALSGANSQP